MSEEIAVSTRGELVRGRMVCGGSVTVDCRTDGTDRLIGAGRNEQLTHERRENDEPHGDEAKPCDSVFMGAELHGSSKIFQDSIHRMAGLHSTFLMRAISGKGPDRPDRCVVG